MLVAERQQYAYSSYPLEQNQPKIDRQPKHRPSPKPKQRLKDKVMPIICLLFVFSLGCLTITRYAVINQNHQHIMELQKQLKKQYTIQQDLNVELASCGDLNRIETVAKEHLGMDYPGKDQIQTVAFPQDEVVMASNMNIIQSSKKNLLQKIFDFLD